jgi:hypothetical protein
MTTDRDGPNPYAPPDKDGEPFGLRPVDAAAAGTMFSPMQIGVATVFGSLIGGSLLLQANYRASREVRAANTVVAASLLATIAMYIFVFSVHLPLSALTINLVAVVTFCWLANSLQGDRYTDHVLTGGTRGSSWWVLGAILVSFAARWSTVAAVKLIVRGLARRA